MWRLACKNFFCGLADSLRGCYKIILLERGSASISSGQGSFPGTAEGSSSSSAVGQPAQTTLSVRRQLRSQQRETSLQRSDEKPKALYRLFQCIFLNIICILLFHFFLIPLIEFLVGYFFGLINNYVGSDYLRTNSEWFSSFFTNLLNALWVLPIFAITRIVNSLWFQDIANAALKRTKSKPGVQLSFSRSVADFCYAILLEAVFLVQTYFVGLLPVPYINLLLKIVHTGLLYGLYSFEYVWMSLGLEMNQRLARIEQNYPYFFGFGLPLTVITMMPSTVFLSGCVFGLCFPVFIVASFEARPPMEIDWEPIKFFWPSVCVCDKLSMSILHKARSKIQFQRKFE